MKLDETQRWVNVSDGGHIENLAAIELLRRRCRFIILGDGEADPQFHFGGLATLIHIARVDLGIDIDIHLDQLRPHMNKDTDNPDNVSSEHPQVVERLQTRLRQWLESQNPGPGLDLTAFTQG